MRIAHVGDRLLTPSKITAWLDCEHYLTLNRQVDEGSLSFESSGFNSLARLLADKGLEHEQACLDAYRSQGLSVFEVPERAKTERFASWVDRVGNPLDADYDVIYQMPLIHNGLRGVADFLVRTTDAETGACWYEPVDAKLARAEAKPGHVLQLCFYSDALEALTGVLPCDVHLWLGSGQTQTIRLVEVRAYWQRLRLQLASLMSNDEQPSDTKPEPCSHCMYCEFAGVCENEWRHSDSLVYVAGIRSSDRAALEGSGVATLERLAELDEPIADVRAERLAVLVTQAELQREARDAQSTVPPFRLINEATDPTTIQGFAAMPAPDDGDVFLDYEGHPFWRADCGLFFLFGLIERSSKGKWVYNARWAHDRAEESDATRWLIEYLGDRRAKHSGMHVYHYNHTERSSLERLAADHGQGELELNDLVTTGLFVDLLGITKRALQAGVESYGLKETERLCAYQRSHDIDQGAGAVVEYESYTKTLDASSLTRIAAYNEDDVRATLAVRDWLIEHRPDGLAWRTAYVELQETSRPDLDEQVRRLHEFEVGTPERLLGDLLGYWLREHRASTAPKIAKFDLDHSSLIDDPEVLTGLQFVGECERLGKNGKRLDPGMEFAYPSQEIATKFIPHDLLRTPTVIFGADEGALGYANIEAIDVEARSMRMTWSERSRELGVVPTSVVLDDWVSPKPKPDAISTLAAALLDLVSVVTPHACARALLARDLPKFNPGFGPHKGVFTDVLDEILAWAPELDHGVVAIQGPPGTGKTYTGAHIVHALIKANKRVGITAMSHHAIDNLLQAVVEVFRQRDELSELRAVRRGAVPAGGALASTEYVGANPQCASSQHNLVAGTTWLFAGTDMRTQPVDVLIVDEAGQLALVDAIAASMSAHNLILLGDPLQLPQVSQAVHPNGSGNSVLQHILGEDTTLPPNRGVFLAETRRMHPDICSVISEQIYESRLTSHESCSRQNTKLGTGLRWLRAEHQGCSTESSEEAAILHDAIAGLIGASWTDHNGKRRKLSMRDFMVVAPYNDQVALIREKLAEDAATSDVRVGTVDKFQGQEAAVVFFTMTTSSAADMPRGADFLFSRNRLNVAISRARCLAYIICTEELLNSRARDLEDMKLISTLCGFVDAAETQAT